MESQKHNPDFFGHWRLSAENVGDGNRKSRPDRANDGLIRDCEWEIVGCG
jgi:hypothetical protein